MKGERRAFADELYAAGRAHDARQEDRLARWRNLEPETAELLGILVRAMGARRVLEIGTSNGYSTIWLGDAVEATGGTVVSLEIDEARTALAAAHLARAGLDGLVELQVDDAADALAGFDDASWDLVFLDAERPAYAGYWPDLVRVLAPPGLLRGRQRDLARRRGRRVPRARGGGRAGRLVARADRSRRAAGGQGLAGSVGA